ncbi:MucBP domain-containing protein [Listeria aquatica]|uniref:MucBP domain-containing protein n=1 Tax=Listeria aquatica TaxID=1494960 RepID=UPI003EF8CE90
MNYMKKFLHQISKHTLMTTMLTFALVMSPAGVTLAAEAPNSKSVSKTVSEQAGKESNTIDPAFDIAHGWDVLEYTDDMDIPVTSTFLEGRKTQMPNGDQYNTAYINFANIGNSLFKAQRVFNLEKGKTYNFTWYYQAHVLGGSQASISFNGDVKTATPIDTNNMDDLLPKPYKKTIVAKEDQNYTVTLEYNAPKYSNVLMSVGYKIGDPNHGVDIEEEAPVQKEKGKVLVQYVDQAGKSIKASTEISGDVGDRYTVKVPRIPGYLLQETSDNVMGTFQSSSQTVTLTYEKIPAVENGKVVVNFVDENGKALTDSPEILTGEVGSSYAAKPKSFPGYQLKKLPDNQAGKFSNQPEEVTFTYEKIPAVENGKVVVNFVDENGKALTDSPEILTGEVGSSYAVKPKSFPGYQLKKLPDNQAGKFSNQPEEVTFIYREIKTSGQGSSHSSNEPSAGSNSGKEENANNENGQVPNSEKPAVPSNGENGSHSNHANSEQAGSSIIDSGAVTKPVKKEWVPQMKASNQPAVPLASDISGAKKTFNAKNSGQNRSNQLGENTELPVTGDNYPVASSLLGLMLILGSICRLKK